MKPRWESVSRSESSFRDAVSARDATGKAYPVLEPNSGTQFPLEARSGKRIPLWGRNLGRSFRLRADPESASHSERQFRVTVSADTDDDPPPLSHAFKYAIQKHKTADRMLFFKKYTSRNLPRLHIQLPFTVADYRPPIQTRNMSPKAGHLPAWLDFGQLLVS